MDMDIMSVSNRRDGFDVKVRCAVMKTPPLGDPPPDIQRFASCSILATGNR